MTELSERMDGASRREDRAQAKLEGAHEAASMTADLKREVLTLLVRALRAVPEEAYAALGRALVGAAVGWLTPAEERRP